MNLQAEAKEIRDELNAKSNNETLGEFRARIRRESEQDFAKKAPKRYITNARETPRKIKMTKAEKKKSFKARVQKFLSGRVQSKGIIKNSKQITATVQIKPYHNDYFADQLEVERRNLFFS